MSQQFSHVEWGERRLSTGGQTSVPIYAFWHVLLALVAGVLCGLFIGGAVMDHIAIDRCRREAASVGHAEMVTLDTGVQVFSWLTWQQQKDRSYGR